MKILSYNYQGDRLIASCKELFLENAPEYSSSNPYEFIIVTPHEITTNDNLAGYPLKKIHSTWKKINQCKNIDALHLWREIWKYGDEIIPKRKIFRIKNDNNNRFFYLANESCTDISNLINNICHFIYWFNLNKNHGVYHCSCVVIEKKGFLFAGKSGAGKSTVAELGKEIGYSVVHDDQIKIYKDNKNRYVICDIAEKKQAVLLQGVFFINQDKTDYLIPLSSIKLAHKLTYNSLDSMADKMIRGDLLKKTFKISADIARHISGYELHFRKSPDFWDMINAELGN